MKKLLLTLLAGILAVGAVLIIRTLSFTPAELPAIEQQTVSVDSNAIARRLSGAIGFRTISAPQANPDYSQFEGFINYLSQHYTQLHSQLNLKRLGNYSLLFIWKGTQPDLAPILLSAHYDVVPVIPDTEQLWTHPPYSGHIDDTHIWGRGALDDKSAVISLMEATSLLLAEGFTPKRTVYISLTHDEEIGGGNGTAAIVQHLADNGVQLAWSLDEGSFVLKGFFPGVDTALASINVAEKGYLTLDLIATAEGGHSSMPPQQTAVGILAEALVKLQHAPIPGGLDGISGVMIETLARQMPFEKRLLFANRWLFDGIIESALSQSPPTNAMLRTTIAPTMLSASVRENVLPINATATINFRLHPRDNVEGVIKHVNSVIDDNRVSVNVRMGQEPSRISSASAAGFVDMAKAARQSFGNILVAPGITIAGTDSRRYEQVTDNAYRFNPMVITSDDLAGIHGTNERVSIDNLIKATTFYTLLIRSASSK